MTIRFGPSHRRLRSHPLAACLAVALSLGIAGGDAVARAVPADSRRDAADYTVSGTAVASAALLGVPVTTCDDSGPGSLRDLYTHAVDNEIIDLTLLPCSRITLTTGALIDPASAANVTLRGAGRDLLAIDGNAQDRVLVHQGIGNLRIEGLTITNGRYTGTYGRGGCIRSNGDLEADASTISGCVVDAEHAYGGAVYVNGVVRLFGSTVADSSVSSGFNNSGGGIYARSIVMSGSTVSGNAAFRGGGIFIPNSASSKIDIEYSTIANNHASYGGGLFVFAPASPRSMRNTTISGNSATFDGGGVFSYYALDTYNCTIARNSADPGLVFAGGLGAGAGMTFSGIPAQTVAKLESTIIAENTTGAGLIEADLKVYFSGSASGSGNLIMAVTQGTAPLLNLTGTVSANPLLGPLRDNGGETWTHALLAGSPAIGRGGNPLLLESDQRGAPFGRVDGAQADIGAFEFADRIFGDGLEP